MDITELPSEKLVDLARQLSYAQTVKDVARLRIQCELDEWELVIAEARRLYAERHPKVAKIPTQRAYRA